MKTPSSLNPDHLAPEELAATLGRFGSWPAGRLPARFFQTSETARAADFYTSAGYAVLHEAFTPAEIEGMKADAAALCRNADGAVRGIEPADARTSDEEAMRRVLCIHFCTSFPTRFTGTSRTPPWSIC